MGAFKQGQRSPDVRPPLEEVFHEIIELSLRPEGFVHGGGRNDLSEVAARLGVPADIIDTSYIEEGLREYGYKVETVRREKHGDALVEVLRYKVVDPRTRKGYYVVVVIGRGPRGSYHEIRSAGGALSADKLALELIPRTLLAVGKEEDREARG